MRPAHQFFIDRGLGSRTIADGLREAGWSVVTMDERYGKHESQWISDDEWITDASGRGEVLLCKDRAVAKRPLEVQAIVRAKARVFVIASAQITGAETLKRLLRNERAIDRQAERRGPFVVGVYADRLAPIRLNRG